ncbi:MAG TPA: Mur ligase family protein [Sphingomicrobium sp.]|nr:Mur ligase family protein [Sphingomicrobium sp.]
MTDFPPSARTNFHFCGIGGSGMLPLAAIVRATGAQVTGSDRALDAGRLSTKFDYLRSLGIRLFAQDGSGVSDGATLVTSAAVEPTIADVIRANELGLEHLTRPELLAQLLNAAATSVAVGGTSGKSTVTGMIGWMLHAMQRRPTVMNGAVMRNFVSSDAPFASALVGAPDLFVSEVDESDGSIALYHPDVAVLGNVSLDHKSMDELRDLFGGFLGAARTAVINLDDPEARQLADRLPAGEVVGFGFDAPGAALAARNLDLEPDGLCFDLETADEKHKVVLAVPGRHNAQNALAALGAVHALGFPLDEAVAALAGFSGLKRRLETVGTAGGVTVIDDFAHNPDKIAATLDTLTAQPGRLLIMFQPHGFGPLAKMGDELARTFASGMRDEDRLFLPDPVYQGGTTDRSHGSDWLAAQVRAAGSHAEHITERAAIGQALLAEAQPGDRIAILGARDDTLSEFAAELVDRLDRGTHPRATH